MRRHGARSRKQNGATVLFGGDPIQFEIFFPDGHMQGRGYIEPDEGRAAEVYIALVADGVLIDSDGARLLNPGRYLLSDGGLSCLSRAA